MSNSNGSHFETNLMTHTPYNYVYGLGLQFKMQTKLTYMCIALRKSALSSFKHHR